MEVTSKILNIVLKPKNHLIFLENKMMLSAFGSAPADLKKGQTYRFSYVEHNGFNNYGGYELVNEEGPQPKVEVEEVRDEPIRSDNRQRFITLGQSANLALQFMLENSGPLTPAEFDIEFKKQTHRFLKLLLELQSDFA